MKPLSLYLHIPFCVRKCAYCDFPSHAGREKDIPAYVDALKGEILDAAGKWPGRRVETVFFGGGTPSILTGEQMKTLMDAIFSSFEVAPDAEISMEANPGTLTPENLAAYRASGINRLSIGVQAMNDRLLQNIGRIHTRGEAAEAVMMAKAAGFENINMDLMYGLPGQSMDDFIGTLRQAAELDVPHLSMYSLIVEEGTPLHRRVSEGEEIPGDEETLAMQHAAARFLSGFGLERYEISNYARPGFECRHNLTYWRRGEYLGLGCAAHSLMEEVRFSNTLSLTEYLSGVREADRQTLGDTDRLEETVMLSLRMREGMDLALYRALCGRDFGRKNAVIGRMEREGLAVCTNARLTLTERGMDVLNAVIDALT